MNLLRIISTMNPASGGPCQGIRNSIPELEKLGVHNEVVSLDDPTDSFLGKDSFQIHAIGPRRGPWGYSEKLIPWLVNNLPRFDIVIIHGLWLYHSYAAVKAIRKFRVNQNRSLKEAWKPSLYVMPHGMLDPYFQRAPERRLKAIRNWIYWKIIESNVINYADGILFTCEAELQLAREPFSPYLPKREINVGYGILPPPIYNSAMREAFLQKCPDAEGHSYILFLSRIHEKKGVDILIEAYSAFVKTSGSSVKLVIAGPGLETHYGEGIRQSVMNDEEINDSVFFSGMLTGDAKWGAFYGCEAFILPSHQENFGIAVVEALACARPVLISNQVNIWREIDEKGGGIVEEDNVSGCLQLLIAWFKLSSEQRQNFGEKALGTFRELFDIELSAKRWITLVK